MSLREALERGPQPHRKKCALAALLEGIDPEDADAVNLAVERVRLEWTSASKGKIGGYSANWLWKTLNDSGMKITKDQVRDHIRRECNCEHS